MKLIIYIYLIGVMLAAAEKGDTNEIKRLAANGGNVNEDTGVSDLNKNI
jgi:hypothetical protein